MRDDSVNCEDLRRALREGRELTKEQSAHVEQCDACADAHMDAWLTMALDAKPEVAIPADFAAQVAAGLPMELPARQEKRIAVRTQRHWGVISAMAVALVVLVVCFLGPKPGNSWVGGVFVMLVASEFAGLALWLGPKWLGR
jgi:AhpD family alkylhydroperoxidase